MNFLDSEIVQQEMKDIEILQNKVYSNVFTFPNMNDKDKIEHIECLEELIGKQQIFYKRLSLSNDPKHKVSVKYFHYFTNYSQNWSVYKNYINLHFFT